MERIGMIDGTGISNITGINSLERNELIKHE
jgi:hypothetical protein